MVFQFKQFTIEQESSAMKIGTDSVLLGCLCEAENAESILDIGTGTGLLALMMAQRSNARIEAVELDENAAQEAAFNFSQSKWKDRLQLHHKRVQDFSNEEKYDLIISNPPYYRHKASMNIADEQRSHARHDKELPFSDLISCIQNLLSTNGVCWMILPTHEAEIFMQLLQKANLNLYQLIHIHPMQDKKANRLVFSFGKGVKPLQEKHFAIYEAENKPTQEYIDLTKEFLLWKKLDN